MQKKIHLADIVKKTPELLLSRDGELRDIQEEFSEYVRYTLHSLVQIFIFQSLSMSLFPNLLFEADPCSNEYLLARICAAALGKRM